MASSQSSSFSSDDDDDRSQSPLLAIAMFGSSRQPPSTPKFGASLGSGPPTPRHPAPAINFGGSFAQPPTAPETPRKPATPFRPQACRLRIEFENEPESRQSEGSQHDPNVYNTSARPAAYGSFYQHQWTLKKFDKFRTKIAKKYGEI